MSYVRSFFKNPHLDFSKINAHFTRKHYCRVCLGRKNRIEHLSGRSILPPLSSSEIPTTVPFPALPKTALWWEFLRFRLRLASLDSEASRTGEAETAGLGDRF